VYYADHGNAAATDFLTASEVCTPVEWIAPLENDGPGGQIGALCTRIQAAGASAYAVDVTSPDVAQLGLTVTKAVAPELCSLDVSHVARFLGGRRLYEAARAVGLRDDVLAESELNPEPHPFP
jgi:ribosomal protein S12 methylthiotransferase accessory factor